MESCRRFILRLAEPLNNQPSHIATPHHYSHLVNFGHSLRLEYPNMDDANLTETRHVQAPDLAAYVAKTTSAPLASDQQSRTSRGSSKRSHADFEGDEPTTTMTSRRIAKPKRRRGNQVTVGGKPVPSFALNDEELHIPGSSSEDREDDDDKSSVRGSTDDHALIGTAEDDVMRDEEEGSRGGDQSLSDILADNMAGFGLGDWSKSDAASLGLEEDLEDDLLKGIDGSTVNADDGLSDITEELRRLGTSQSGQPWTPQGGSRRQQDE